MLQSRVGDGVKDLEGSLGIIETIVTIGNLKVKVQLKLGSRHLLETILELASLLLVEN